MRRWTPLDPEQMRQLAADWLREKRGEATDADRRVGMTVVMMNFTAPPDQQWSFILEAVAQATTDEELGHIAAGPIEHLLGWHGDASIDRVEAQAAKDPKFARTVTGVWKYLMSDPIWTRVQALQARVPDPLPKRTNDTD